MIRIPRSEYVRRCKALMTRMEPSSIAILPTALTYTRNHDVEHVYCQDSDFQYLIDFPEPEAVMALIPDRAYGECVFLYCERDLEHELWDSLRAGQDGTIGQYGADDTSSTGDIDGTLPGLIESRDWVYYALSVNPDFDRRLMNWANVIRSKARQGA